MLLLGIFIREASSRIYSPYVFALAQLLGEIPYTLVCGVIYWVLMVYPQGFGQGSEGLNGTGFQLLVVLLMIIFGVSFGQLLSAISPSVQVAVLFNPFFALIFGTFCGVSIPYPNLIPFWRWLYQAIPYTRYLAAMITTELV
jgi:ATP-binding cassette, subfamily G (WHITE), member 2, SNQ2